MGQQALVVSLHDVSPHTFEACRQIISELEREGVSRTSLLVVPDHHHKGHFLQDEDFCAWLKQLAENGHEPVIHGYYHRRARRAEETLTAKLTTRVYTADEGEFFDIERSEASALVSKARGEFQSIGLSPTGFIAPAWLLSSPAEAALRDLGIHYTTRLGSVLNIASGQKFASQSLVWSVRSGWRRVVSLAWNATLFRRLRANPLLRISVHPVDLQHPAIWRQILRLTQQALRTRIPHTYESWISEGISQSALVAQKK